MGYFGDTYAIPCDRGGFTFNPNIDKIPPEMMVEPTKNICLNEGGREKRKGTSHVNSSALASTPQLMGVHDFVKKDGTAFRIMATSDGKIYKDDSTTIKTGLTNNAITTFVTFNDTLYICNGADIPQTWDGIAGGTSNLANIPTDWNTNTDYPKQMVKHGRGVSERLWAIGFEVHNYKIYASDNGTDDFSDANVITLNIDTGDGIGLVGGAEFGDRLILFSKRFSFIIEDSSSDTADWGYQKAQWEGGAANLRLIVRTPNDLIAMMEDGTAYSVSALQSYGDYKVASITKPSYIDKWLKENALLSDIEKFHAIFDPVDRAVLFFIVRNGQSSIDTALVYYIDRGPEEGWMIYDNQTTDSGYSASCASLFRTGPGNYEVYTGDYSGFVWKLNQNDRSDNGNGYWAGFRTPWLPFDNPRVTKNYKRGWGVVQAEGNYDLEVRWWVDGIEGTATSIDLTGTGGLLDSFVLGTDVLGGEDLIDKDFDIGDIGKRISLELYNNTANEQFFISQILVDHRVYGARPD